MSCPTHTVFETKQDEFDLIPKHRTYCPLLLLFCNSYNTKYIFFIHASQNFDIRKCCSYLIYNLETQTVKMCFLYKTSWQTQWRTYFDTAFNNIKRNTQSITQFWQTTK